MGCYLMSARGRGGYLILGVVDKGRRGGLGRPVHISLVLTVERVSRSECEANRHLCWPLVWDRRVRRRT